MSKKYFAILAIGILGFSMMFGSSALAAMTYGATTATTDGAYTLDGITSSTYLFGPSTTTGTITIGGTAQTGSTTLRSSTATGSTTTSAFVLNAGAITSGTALYLTTTAADGNAVVISDNALTTGVGISVPHTTSVIADGGSLMRLSSSSTDTGGATNGTLLDLKSTGQLAGTTVRLDNILTTGTGMSIIGTGILTGAGNLLTLTGNSATDAAGLLRINANGLTSGIAEAVASSSTAMTGNLASLTLSGSNVANTGALLNLSSSGVASISPALVATVASTGAFANGGVRFNFSGAHTGNGVQVDDVTTAGNAMALNANSLVGGNGLVVAGTGTGLTGNLFSATSASTAAASNGLARFNFTGAHTGNGLQIDDVTTAGKAVQINANSVVGGTGVEVNTNGLTTGLGLGVLHTTSIIAAGGSLARLSSTSVDTSTTTGTLLDLSATATTVGKLVNIASSAAAQTTSTLLNVVASGYTTGYTGDVVKFTGVSTDGASNVLNIVSANTSAGNALSVTAASATTGGGIVVTSPSSNALAVGLNGKTGPAFVVDASTAVSVTGLKIKSGINTGGLALSVVSSGASADENLTIDAKGAGTITLGGTSTGNIITTRAVTLTGGASNATESTINWAKGGTAINATDGNDTAVTSGDRYWVELQVPFNITLTGLTYLIGSVGGTDKVIVELHNSAGTLVATSDLAGTTVGTAANMQAVAFTGTYAATAGKYFAVVQFNGTTAKFRTYTIPGSKFVTGTAAGVFGTSAAITPGTSYTANKGPVISTY